MSQVAELGRNAVVVGLINGNVLRMSHDIADHSLLFQTALRNMANLQRALAQMFGFKLLVTLQ